MTKKKKEKSKEDTLKHTSTDGEDGKDSVTAEGSSINSDVLKDTEEKVGSKDIEVDTDEQTASTEENITEEQRDPVEVLEEELKEQKDKYLRLMAEFDNYKRRTGKEYERLVESANERLMLDIIEVRENFERALAMADESHDFVKFLEGMKLIFDKLDDNLKKNGLTVFTEIGDEFNPEIHDAMMKTPNDEIPEDHVVQIYEKGYKLKNRVIKHAKVIVSAGIPSETEKEQKEEESEEKVKE